jgi:hypothetical protein
VLRCPQLPSVLRVLRDYLKQGSGPVNVRDFHSTHGALSAINSVITGLLANWLRSSAFEIRSRSRPVLAICCTHANL